IERMVQEAEMYRNQDRKKKELAEARNLADNAAYAAEKFLRELGDQVPAEARKNLEEKVRALRESLSGEDVARIRQRTAELNEALQAIGAQMYQGAGPAASPPPSEEEGPEGDVIEGEFSAD
ncbi:MAG TPA: molecular chaperone DnaK, partial [Chloroflexi bacterium]|nr:molecular chaperone DnaK [Chloroflexota bacterium]